MNNEIITTHEPNEDLGLQRRKRLTGISVNIDTMHVNLSYAIETLSPTGSVLRLDNVSDNKSFDKRLLNTPTGTIGGELPEDVEAFANAVITAVKSVFENHCSVKEDVKDEE